MAIDLEKILTPLPGANPAGRDPQLNELSDVQRLLREMELRRKEQEIEPTAGDWLKVFNLTHDALAHKTRDLRLAAYLAEAAVKLHGFAGLRDGLRVMRGLIEEFWPHLYPTVEDGDLEWRIKAVELIDARLPLPLRQVALTNNGSENYSYLQWQEAQGFDIPENLDDLSSHQRDRVAELRARAEQEKKLTADLWRKAKRATPDDFYLGTAALLEEANVELTALDRALDEKFVRIPAGLEQLHNVFVQLLAQEAPDLSLLKDVAKQAQPVLQKTRGIAAFKQSLDTLLDEDAADLDALQSTAALLLIKETPNLAALKQTVAEVASLLTGFVAEINQRNPAPVATPEKPMAEEQVIDQRSDLRANGHAVAVAATNFTGPIGSRQEALQRLAEVAAYFQQAEPHSPVSYLVQRAINWGQMPLEEWLGDVIKDGGVLGQLRETLGIKSES